MSVADATRLLPALTPTGRLSLRADADAIALDPALAQRLHAAFATGAGPGLLHLGAVEVGRALPATWTYWQTLGARVVTALCMQAEAQDHAPAPPDDLATVAAQVPPMPGAEYATAETLRALWEQTTAAFTDERRRHGESAQSCLQRLNPAWHVVGRVHFNLAENRQDEQAPFAFLATYTHKLSGQGKALHQPLGEALREYAGAADKAKLLSLLVPVQRAAEPCAWLRALIDSGEIFHPLRWSAEEAFRLLTDAHELERAGVIVRMPATWTAGRPSRPQVTATVGSATPTQLGAEALLDFRMELTLDGVPLSPEEIKAILASTQGLALVRGQWVEVDGARVRHMMDSFAEAERLAASEGLSFGEAMRTLAGADVERAVSADPETRNWGQTVAGPWLAKLLGDLRTPEGLAAVDPGPDLHGTLRPYQAVGVRWLHLLSRLGLGACLADDMGLGKTLQVLALLVVRQREASTSRRPSVLVAPASLLANWAAEVAKFAPGLNALVAHGSAMSSADLKSMSSDALANIDLVITSYGALTRLPWLTETRWHLAILDEAQAIKNAGALQTRATKRLQAHARIALTGTPIENRVGDLWSIFDFINPGLLGTGKQFTTYTKRLAAQPAGAYGPLRELVRPYILRRLKTDRRVIADLPDKTELKAYCALSRTQAALYQQTTLELGAKLKAAEGIKRRGVVLASLIRLKQICNHPSQWLGDGAWREADSGKWARLRELAEVIAAKQEKVLVFTQFRELTAPLASFLAEIFGRPGLVLHGGTAVKQRQVLVKRFQTEDDPFFVLSLKAGGSGLNLTAAAHVIHFDRWWNPAVENQATDRAFRIGQKQNVLVHKFVCRGTVEEKIDSMIESKRALTRDLLDGADEVNLTSLSDRELLDLVSLDLNQAMKEA